MNKTTVNFLCAFALILGISLTTSASNKDPKRAEEVRLMLWNNSDKDFEVKTIPEKWENQSAVVISRSFLLTYKKAVIAKKLRHHNYKHERIMLLDKASIEEYSQFTIPADGSYSGTMSTYYTGFKVIKPNGMEVEVPFSEAVSEQRDINGSKYNQWKLAIPNLEPGDILDYYIVEEQDIQLYSNYGLMTHIFNPVIFQLNGDYPIMKQKIRFDVLRKCYINLRTLNGAPEFIASGDEEENSYILEDSNRESVKDIRWLYPNRQLPSVKFKVMFTNSHTAYTFFENPGELNSQVTKEKLKDLVSSYFELKSTEGYLYYKDIKKKYSKEKDQVELAKNYYYYLRNREFAHNDEGALLSGGDGNSGKGNFISMIMISNVLKENKIPHSIIIGVNREISSLEDLILENELMLMIKVNTPQPFYIGRFTGNSVIGEIEPDMQGIDAYEVDGLEKNKNWDLKKITVPTTTADNNNTSSYYRIGVADLENDVTNINLERSALGMNRVYYQNVLMDFYDYEEEEKSRFEMPVDFDNHYKSARKQLLKKKEDYLSSRNDNTNERLKQVIENDLDLAIKEVRDLKIIQSGRYDDNPEFKYSCNATVNGAVKKVGNNYLINIGKFIDGQIKPTEEEKGERDYDIYFPYARSYGYKIEFVIPDGYEAQGLEKLNYNVENSSGSFTSVAELKGNTLVVESFKSYKSNFEKKENWPAILEFLDAAYEFTQQQILLKKI